MTGRTYASPAAMRAALEQRLLDRSRSAKLPLDRLRKEAAIQRLLARVAAKSPAGSWARKGGIAMIARAGERARATSDADATWRAGEQMLHDTLDRGPVLPGADRRAGSRRSGAACASRVQSQYSMACRSYGLAAILR
jgi:hypothetical protein